MTYRTGRLAALIALLSLAPAAALVAQENDVQPAAHGIPLGDTRLSLSRSFQDVAEIATPSVVRVIGHVRRGEVTGSGFVIRSGAYIVTNHHVVSRANSLLVEFVNGERYPAEVVGSDALTDLAVISIDHPDVPALSFGDDTNLKVGEWVVAVGHPQGLPQTVTSGIVSARNRRLDILNDGQVAGYEAYIQTDAAINQGNSGGPLLNLNAEVVGVNAAIVTSSGGSQGLGFAIPTSLASHVVDQLIRHGEVRRGQLGVYIQDISGALARSYGVRDGEGGVLVTRVLSGGPAEGAGLEANDVVISVNGEAVRSDGELRNRVAFMEPGSWVTLAVLRDGRQREFRVRLAELPTSSPRVTTMVFNPERDGRLGVEFDDLTAPERGVAVRSVVYGGPAFLAGIEPGDIVGRMEVVDVSQVEPRVVREIRPDSADELSKMIAEAPAGRVLRLHLIRRIGRMTTEVVQGVELP